MPSTKLILCVVTKALDCLPVSASCYLMLTALHGAIDVEGRNDMHAFLLMPP
jgi:hypothetical protein